MIHVEPSSTAEFSVGRQITNPLFCIDGLPAGWTALGGATGICNGDMATFVTSVNSLDADMIVD